VPTLVRDDGSVLTEFGAIATWLARTTPAAGLIPDGAEAQARVTEVLEYVEGTVHGQGFARLFMPARFEPQDALHGKVGLGKTKVEDQGRKMVHDGFAILDRQLVGKTYVGGDKLSIADSALFYVERWAPQKEIALPANVNAHFQRMLSRPSVQRVRAFWGES
jgi:glutathione S-transferase